MTVDAFASTRRHRWERLDALLADARRRPERLGPDGVRELGALYRSAAADLAVARRKYPSDPVVGRLEGLVGRARHLVYDAPATRGSLREFLTTRYWQRVRERPLLLVLAGALLFVPMIGCAVWALRDPGAAAGLVPAPYQAVTEPRPSGSVGFTADESTAFSAQIFTNNIRVTLFALAGGIALGAVTALVLAYNGVLIGTILGLAVGSGNGETFVSLVVAHGVLELSCIVVAGAAGLRVGSALLDPGHRSRGAALRTETRAAVEIALGTAPWLVLAGIVEGFVTPAGAGLVTNAVVGVALGAVYWALVGLRGAPAASA